MKFDPTRFWTNNQVSLVARLFVRAFRSSANKQKKNFSPVAKIYENSILDRRVSTHSGKYFSVHFLTMDESENITRRRSERINPEQLEYLINYMQSNPRFRDSKFSSDYTKAHRKREWERLTSMLNSLGGANKDAAQWRKVSALYFTNTSLENF